MCNFFMYVILCLLFLIPVAFGAEFKDPTEPPDVDLQTAKLASSDRLHRLNLNEIVIQGSNKWAVINETVVKVGDKILGEKVVDINPSRVQLKGESGEIRLYLMNDQPIKEISQ